MGSNRKRKHKTTSSKEERSGDKVTPKKKGVEKSEDPAEGCSRQVEKNTTPEKELTKKPSFIMGLQRRWSRIADYLRNTRDDIMQKGLQFWAGHGNAQPERRKKRKASAKTSSEAEERSAQERSRKRTRTEHQGSSRRSRGSSGSPKIKREDHADSKKGSKKERKISMRKSPKGQEEKTEKRKRRETYSSSGITTDSEQAGPSKRLRAEPKAHGTATQETLQRAAASPTSTVPLTLDKFTFHHVLGEGSFGQVLLATDSIRKQRVAVKITQKNLLRDFREELVEGRILRMTHGSRFLVHGYGAFHTKQRMYYIMELVSGGTLDQLMRDHLRLDLPTIRFLAAEMVCGIQFLHSKGIIHRDLKTNNVLLTRDGHIKITDFGLSLDNVFGKTITRGFVGTRGFAAPEIIRGEPYGAAVDWFSFGVIMHILVIGVNPFSAHTPELMDKLTLTYKPTFRGLDFVVADFLTRLLFTTQSLRLGVHGDIRKHPFFSTVQWGYLEAGKVLSPIEMRTYSTNSQMENQIPVAHWEEPSSQYEQELLKDFPFVCSAWAVNYHKAPMH